MHARPPGRHEIRFSDSQGTPYDPPLIIDDTIDQAPVEFEKPVVVLTRRELVVYRPDRNERRVLELTSRADMDVTRDEIESFLTSLPNWVPAVGYLLAPDGLAGLPLRSGVPLRIAHADVREKPQRDARLRRRAPCLGRRGHARDRRFARSCGSFSTRSRRGTSAGRRASSSPRSISGSRSTRSARSHHRHSLPLRHPGESRPGRFDSRGRATLARQGGSLRPRGLGAARLGGRARSRSPVRARDRRVSPLVRRP